MSESLTNSKSSSGTRIDWVDSSCRLLQATRAEFADTQPFNNLTIGMSIHLEPKTAALIVTLHQGGAKIIATGNLNSTQPETVAYLKGRGITVVGHQTKDASIHGAFLDQIVASQPDLLLDNGAISSPAILTTLMKDSWVVPKRRHQVECVLPLCASRFKNRYWSSTIVPSNSLPKTIMPLDKAR